MLSPPPDLSAPFSQLRFSSSPVVAAVSGGSDSTALLILLKTFLDRQPSAPRLVAVTIDHDLRAGSHAEACAVGALAARLGVEHRIMKWDGEKPATRRAATARIARYGLLAIVARQIGATMILTGHTADDQAETVAMRQSRGTGLGMAGMAPATLFDGAVWITRPFLGTWREALRQVLRAQNIDWTDDPSNVDRRSERVRVRSALADDSPEEIDRLLKMARQAAMSRHALGLQAARLIESHARQAAPGLFHLDPGFIQAPEPEATYALRILLAVVGGCEHLADEQRTRALCSRLAYPPYRATLSRTMIASRRDGGWLCRETRGLPRLGPAIDGMIWDGRFRLTGAMGAGSIASAAGEGSAFAPANASLPSSIARAANAAQPVFFDRLEIMDRYAAPGWSATPILAPWATFLPSFDLAPARAVARLVGAEPVPDPPLADHIVTPA